MRDLTGAKLLYFKAGLFVLCGLLASMALLAEHPTLKTAALLALAVWCFARAYYFAFYVVERYVDPGYRFAGLWSFAGHLLRCRRGGEVYRRESGNERSTRGAQWEDVPP
jgi:hypothetical protein